MCRAMMYLGEPVQLDDLLFKPDSSLVNQAYMPKMLHMLNLAGFGMMAWDASSFLPQEPHRPAGGDANQHGIEQGIGVVSANQHRSRLWDLLRTADFQPWIESTHNPPHQAACQRAAPRILGRCHGDVIQ